MNERMKKKMSREGGESECKKPYKGREYWIGKKKKKNMYSPYIPHKQCSVQKGDLLFLP